jgi:hypothetical protein
VGPAGHMCLVLSCAQEPRGLTHTRERPLLYTYTDAMPLYRSVHKGGSGSSGLLRRDNEGKRVAQGLERSRKLHSTRTAAARHRHKAGRQTYVSDSEDEEGDAANASSTAKASRFSKAVQPPPQSKHASSSSFSSSSSSSSSSSTIAKKQPVSLAPQHDFTSQPPPLMSGKSSLSLDVTVMDSASSSDDEDEESAAMSKRRQMALQMAEKPPEVLEGGGAYAGASADGVGGSLSSVKSLSSLSTQQQQQQQQGLASSSEDDEETDESSSSEEEEEQVIRPFVFRSKKQRMTMKQDEQVAADVQALADQKAKRGKERKAETREMLLDAMVEDPDVDQKKKIPIGGVRPEDLPDDTDDLDAAGELMAWKVREMRRIKVCMCVCTCMHV